MDYKNLKGVVKGKFLYNDGTQQWDTEVKVTKMDIQVLYDCALDKENRHFTSYCAAREVSNEIIEEFRAKPRPSDDIEDKKKFVSYFAKGCTKYMGGTNIFDETIYKIAMENFTREYESAYGSLEVVNRIEGQYKYWYRIRKQCEDALKQYK